jgi:hypothetical protein
MAADGKPKLRFEGTHAIPSIISASMLSKAYLQVRPRHSIALSWSWSYTAVVTWTAQRCPAPSIKLDTAPTVRACMPTKLTQDGFSELSGALGFALSLSRL